MVANHSFRRLLGVTAVPHERTLKYLSEFSQRHCRSESMKAKGEAIYNVEISQFVTVELFCNIEKGLTKIRGAHVIINTVG